MSPVKVGRLQRKVFEIGLVGRLAHNLAKYIVNVDGAYDADSFLVEVRTYMVNRGVEAENINRWLENVQSQAQQEVDFFIMNGRFAESSGGTSIAVCALIGPILDELGYE